VANQPNGSNAYDRQISTPSIYQKAMSCADFFSFPIFQVGWPVDLLFPICSKRVRPLWTSLYTVPVNTRPSKCLLCTGLLVPDLHSLVRRGGQCFGRKAQCGQWRRLYWALGARVSHFYKWLGTGGTVKNSKQEPDQTVLAITNALTKTTNIVLLEPKKWRGTTNFFSDASFRTGAPPPTFAPD